MWVTLAIVSALCLGFYDVMKKLSLDGNNVLGVLFLNTVFSSILMLPIIIIGVSQGNYGLGNSLEGHGAILIKSGIVLTSWLLGYASIKHLPLTIAGPVNASRPVLVLVGALLIFGERLNLWQWAGVILGFWSLFFISRVGGKEGFSLKSSKWVWMAIGATAMGAVSALYDKYLLTRYEPLEVQAWYSLYQMVIMGITIGLILRNNHGATLSAGDGPSPHLGLSYRGRHSILLQPFHRGVNDCRGVDDQTWKCNRVILLWCNSPPRKNIRLKLIDLTLLLIGLTFLVIGSM